MLAVFAFPRLKARYGLVKLSRASCCFNGLLFVSMITWHPIAKSIAPGSSRITLWLAMSLTLAMRIMCQFPVSASPLVGAPLTASVRRDHQLAIGTYAITQCDHVGPRLALRQLCVVHRSAAFVQSLCVRDLADVADARAIARSPESSSAFVWLSLIGFVTLPAAWSLREGEGWREAEAAESFEAPDTPSSPSTPKRASPHA